jgi:hypothetical protein
LKRGVHYDLSDMAVTSDNKLLLCTYRDKKVYIYKDYKTYEDKISFTSEPCCITVVPCTDKAVVTLPSYLYITWPSKLIQHNPPSCLNNNWSFLSLYNKLLLEPRSVDIFLTSEQQGHVYISGADDIHRLSPDGTFRDIVLSKHDGVDEPWSITFNNDFTKLFIINGGSLIGGRTVLVYSCKWRILIYTPWSVNTIMFT